MLIQIHNYLQKIVMEFDACDIRFMCQKLYVRSLKLVIAFFIFLESAKQVFLNKPAKISSHSLRLY